MPSFELERHLSPFVIGFDEAGCGPWAGPVVAGAVLFKNTQQLSSTFLKLIDDSKKLTKLKREKAFQELQVMDNSLIASGMGVVSAAEIDQINIRQASLLAMVRAYEDLRAKDQMGLKATHALVDGISRPLFKNGCGHTLPVTLVKKGDSISYSIAAASIIAKVTRDKMMTDLHREYPNYGWDKNAGYGTKSHQEGLKAHGVTVYHRKSYAPIVRLLEHHGEQKVSSLKHEVA